MNQIKFYGIKCIIYAFSIVYGIFSVVKMIEGYSNKNLFASYGIMQENDYIQIGIIIFFAGIVSVTMVYALHKFRKGKVIENFVAYLFLLLFFLFVIYGEISNKAYCCSYVICLVCAGAKYLLQEKGKVINIPYFTLRNWKVIVPELFFWVVSIVLCIPIELYLNNPGDFQFLFWYYFGVLLLGCLLLVVITFFTSIFLLTIRQADILATALFALTFMGYVQRMILNRGMRILDGDTQEWSLQTKIINTLIWCVVIIVIVICKVFIKNIGGIYAIISVYLVLVQVISIGYLILTGNTNSDASFKAFTKESSLEIDSGNNVIVLLLDRFDTELLQTIINEDENFIEPLKDFTFYPNSTGAFSRTSMAIPYLLTGTQWVDGMSQGEYPSYAYSNSSLLSTIMQAGYDVAIYTEEDYVEEPYRTGIINYDEDIEQKCGFWNTLSTMMKCSKYTVAPICMKESYAYYSSAINDLVVNKNIWRIDDDLGFYKDLIETGLSIKETGGNKGTFYFYHFFGPHEPTNMTQDLERAEEGSVSLEEQTKASLKILFEYMSQLKLIGKYEDATIIITADHGIQLEGQSYRDNGIVDRTTSPTILVKRPYETNEELMVNEAPVSQAEFIPTVLSAMGIDYKEYGRTFEEVQLDEERIRIYASVWEDKYDKFVIYGDVRKKENWILEESNY